jgi:hypothetical protein
MDAAAAPSGNAGSSDGGGMEDYGFHQTKGSRGLGLGKQARGKCTGSGEQGSPIPSFGHQGGKSNPTNT